jgi:hypothetical protein
MGSEAPPPHHSNEAHARVLAGGSPMSTQLEIFLPRHPAPSSPAAERILDRLGELVADANCEPDPLERVQLHREIQRLRDELRRAT